jgi:hypothetical protein
MFVLMKAVLKRIASQVVCDTIGNMDILQIVPPSLPWFLLS